MKQNKITASKKLFLGCLSRTKSQGLMIEAQIPSFWDRGLWIGLHQFKTTPVWVCCATTGK